MLYNRSNKKATTSLIMYFNTFKKMITKSEIHYKYKIRIIETSPLRTITDADNMHTFLVEHKHTFNIDVHLGIFFSWPGKGSMSCG